MKFSDATEMTMFLFALQMQMTVKRQKKTTNTLKPTMSTSPATVYISHYRKQMILLFKSVQGGEAERHEEEDILV